ncbi:MAG: hypothetical protein AAF487_07755 [Bacteroidota bacterium]
MRYTFVFIFLLCFSGFGLSQGKIGPSVAINNTWIYNANILNAHRGLQYRFSYAPSFGISHVYLGDVLRYRVGVNYNGIEQQLYAEYWHDFDQSFLSTTRIKMAEIPLYIGFENEHGFFFEMGLNAYYLLHAKEIIELEQADAPITENELTFDFKRATFGFGSAIGKEFPNNLGGRLSISGEFQLGFSDITKQSLSNGIFDSSFPNSFLNAMAHDGFEDVPQVTNYKTSSVFYIGVRVALLFPYD